MALAVEDLINAALRRVGYPTPVGSIYEGSRAARVALDYYGQTRDALFSEFDWSFLQQVIDLGNPIKTAPPAGYGVTPWNPALNPPPPWVYEFAYPANCINVRSVRPLPIFIPEGMPRVNIFQQVFDAQLQAKVIVTNLARPLAVITARVTNPAEWQDNDFIDSLIERLAVLFGRELGKDPNDTQIGERMAIQAKTEAEERP
jgi:hypothetical protein